MHKEAVLDVSSAHRLFEVPAESRSTHAGETAKVFALVRTPFGSAMVVDRVPEVDAGTWAQGLDHAAHDHRYYELTHEALGHQFEHRYLLLKDHDGRTRAVQPFLVVEQDLTTGLPDTLRSAVGWMRRQFPSSLILRMLMVGSAAGEGHLVTDRSTGGMAWVAEALRDSLPEIARALGARMVVFKDFPQNYRETLGILAKDGYARIPSMPGSRLELDFEDFDHYLTTKLSHKTRKNLRYKYRKAAAHPPLELQVVSDIAPYIDEVFPLYQQVLARSTLKFEELTKSYFISLGRRMNERAMFFIWRQNGKAVAFSSCLCHEGVLRDHYIGLDYEVAIEQHLYFVTWRDMFNWALENGFRTYYSAPLNYEPKYHLRHELVPLDLYVRTTWSWLNPIFRPIVRHLEPTRYDPMIQKFANAHDLW